MAAQSFFPSHLLPATRSMNVHDEPSFDPRTWIAPDLQKPAEPTATNGRRRASAFGSAPFLAPCIALALLLAGAGVAVLARPENAAHSSPTARPMPIQNQPTLRTAALSSRRTLVLGDIQELAEALHYSGITGPEADKVVAQVGGALGEAAGEIRLILDLKTDDAGAVLMSLEAVRDSGAGLLLHRMPDGSLAAQQLASDLETRLTVVRGELDSHSFYSSAVSAGVTDSLINDLANAFSFDFDMQREVAPGDVFEVAFEQAHNPSGEAVGVPRLMYVSLRTSSKSRTLYRFTPPGEREAGWFDGNGLSTVRALMRTPVDSARISSQFGMRSHPILGYQRMHRGTDFAAPTGTPVFAAGSATVEFAGMKGANGNFVVLLHDGGWRTLYLHLNRIMPGIEPGVRVTQGHQIGEIGTTGRSTGPHLHYEVHIDGQPVDPLTIDVGTSKPLTEAARGVFHKQRDRIDTQRASAKT